VQLIHRRVTAEQAFALLRRSTDREFQQLPTSGTLHGTTRACHIATGCPIPARALTSHAEWLLNRGRRRSIPQTLSAPPRQETSPMPMTTDDQGTIVALLDRFRLQRLPTALALKEKVDRGEKLGESDLDFLAQVFDDMRHVTPIVDRNPELADVAGKISALYKAITAKALANEQGS
jgi:hypothetical protein